MFNLNIKYKTLPPKSYNYGYKENKIKNELLIINNAICLVQERQQTCNIAFAIITKQKLKKH